ncbi:MAG: purine-nucleoside phosphorylase [Lactobacillales bacterium]|jgi:purine-nucleoside phosphorylase|nr:purine-nucleoside phosphorylase [Lactobacillales bacterium]
MPTPHIAAQKDEIAEKILLPGDPLRAKFIAENYLKNVRQFNQVRNMLGFTGIYKNERVSVMGTGMGIPSFSIYAHELIQEYGVKTLIRIGTAGSLSKKVHVRDLVLAQSAATTSRIIRNEWPEYDLPQTANFQLLQTAHNLAKKQNLPVHVGTVLSSDLFYNEEEISNKNIKLGKYGVLAVEMETAALYYLGAKLGVQTLALLTISDSLITKESLGSQERQTSFQDMMVIGLETLIKS